MAKEIVKIIKIQIPAGKAMPAPPIGPVLGQAGIQIAAFCKEFNDSTNNHPLGIGTPLTVIITVYKDKSYSFEVKQPPMAYLIKKEIGLEKGSGTPNTKKVAVMSRSQAENVAKVKMEDLNCHDIDAAVEVVFGQARSMGISRES